MASFLPLIHSERRRRIDGETQVVDASISIALTVRNRHALSMLEELSTVNLLSP
jgi:hypothetical protein